MYAYLNWVVWILNAVVAFCFTIRDNQQSPLVKYKKPKLAATKVNAV